MATLTGRLAHVGLACAALALAGMATAQGGAALVDPASIVYKPQRGETVTGTVRLSNPGTTALGLRLYVSDWTMNMTGQFEFADPGTLERSASTWLSLPASKVELGPRESRAIDYTLSVPEDATDGTHWTVIFAESEPTAPEPGQPTAAISVRVGHIVYVNLPGYESAGEVLGLFGDPPAEPGRPYTVVAHYANAGNVAQSVAGSFTLRNSRGEVVRDAEIERSIVLPASERLFIIDVYGPLEPGNYTALVVLNYGDEERDVAGSLDLALDEALTTTAGTDPADDGR